MVGKREICKGWKFQVLLTIIMSPFFLHFPENNYYAYGQQTNQLSNKQVGLQNIQKCLKCLPAYIAVT